MPDLEISDKIAIASYNPDSKVIKVGFECSALWAEKAIGHEIIHAVLDDLFNKYTTAQYDNLFRVKDFDDYGEFGEPIYKRFPKVEHELI